MKKNTLLIILVSILTGCTYFNSDQDSNQNSPTSTQRMCKELKRNLIFNSTSNFNMGKSSATERARMTKMYEKYGCANIDKK